MKPEIVHQVKLKCLTFLEKAFEEMDKRIPDNWDTLQGMSLLSPNKILSQDIQGNACNIALKFKFLTFNL